MGLKWRHHSRHYIIAWENGPYLVYEKRWWKHKRIAQFDYSLDMAIWYVQELEPNASISMVWMPRGAGVRPAPLPPTAAAHEKQAYHLVACRNVGLVDRRDGTPATGQGKVGDRPAPYGPIRPGDTVIALAKPPKSKYALRRMNWRGVMEDVP